MFFISRNKLGFFGMFFLYHEINCFFRKSATNQCARWAEKNTCFFGNALPISNARSHLKQRRKHSGLTIVV